MIFPRSSCDQHLCANSQSTVFSLHLMRGARAVPRDLKRLTHRPENSHTTSRAQMPSFHPIIWGLSASQRLPSRSGYHESNAGSTGGSSLSFRNGNRRLAADGEQSTGSLADGAPIFPLAVRARAAVRAVTFPLAMWARAAVRAVLFQLAVLAAVAVHAVAFPIAVLAAVAVRAVAFQFAVRARVAEYAAEFHFVVRARTTYPAVWFLSPVQTTLVSHRSRPNTCSSLPAQ